MISKATYSIQRAIRSQSIRYNELLFRDVRVRVVQYVKLKQTPT